jgi:hypothetical protein
MNTDTAAATANCSMMMLRDAVPSSLGPVCAKNTMKMRMTQPLTKLPVPCCEKVSTTCWPRLLRSAGSLCERSAADAEAMGYCGRGAGRRGFSA